MKLPILFFLIILLSISFISSVELTKTSLSEEIEVFKKGDSIDLKIQCLNNGTFCTSSASCNLTVMYPNNTLLVNSLLMTNQVSFYNFTLPNSQTLGLYACSVTCCDNDICGTDSKQCVFRITTTGEDDWNTLPLFLLLGSFIIFGLASYLKNEYIGLLSGFMLLISGVYMMVYGLSLFQDMYTRAISFITLGMGLMVCFISIVEMFYTDLGIMNNGGDD